MAGSALKDGAVPPKLSRLRNTAVGHVIAPGPMGGAESVVRLLARGLRHQGGRPRIYAIIQDALPHPFVDEARAEGLEVTEIRCGRRRYGAETELLARMLQTDGVTVVHTHGYHGDMVGRRAARAAGLPAFSTVHGFTGGGWRNRMYEWLQRREFRKFDAVVAVSEPLGALLARKGVPRDLVRVIPNAYASAAQPLAREAARTALGVPVAGKRIGWVGRLCEEKGADVLIDAVAALQGPGVMVSVLGDGPERAALESRASGRGIAGRIRWHGTIPEAGRLLKAFDALVISSRTEGMPIVLFESMAAEVPVVATAVGGIPTVVSDNEALLVPAEAPADLARAIDETLADPARASERAARAAQRLRSAFDVDTWLTRYDDLYERRSA